MKEKIFLLVDDDDDDRDLFERAVKSIEGGVYYGVAGGPKMLEYLSGSQQLPDVIFLDVNMPEMSGWECLEILKSNKRYKNIPVLMYSTSSHSKDIKKAEALGAMTFCVKPDDYAELRKLIRLVKENIHKGVHNLLPILKENKMS
ncbi:MAG: response regulator [Bacteroidetes bacterium]|nr:response regulator [Bacteroidota bacterium]